MPVSPENSKAVVYLRENGPSPTDDLPVSGFGENVRELIRTIHVRGGPGGGGSAESVAGGLTRVAYLAAEHDLERALRVWLDVNAEKVSRISNKSLRWRLRATVASDQRDLVSTVLDEEGFEVDHSDRGTSGFDGFECDLCGESVRDLASHLTECPKR